MTPLVDQIYEKGKNCKTIENWEEIYDWLCEKAEDTFNHSRYFESALQESVDKNEFAELIHLATTVYMEREAQEENQLPPIVEKMLQYGYTDMENMVPINDTGAMDFYQRGWRVFRLYPDNTEKEILSPEEIKEHIFVNGMFGIKTEELQKRWAQTQESRMEEE